MADVTRSLSAIDDGDPRAAEERLPLVYDRRARKGSVGSNPTSSAENARKPLNSQGFLCFFFALVGRCTGTTAPSQRRCSAFCASGDPLGGGP
jgi:hypothetical protein